MQQYVNVTDSIRLTTLDGTAKTKLATLVFLYCGEFVKTSNAVSSVNHQSEIQSSFSQTIQKCQLWHFCLYYVKTKIPVTKCYPQQEWNLGLLWPLIASRTVSFLH